MKRRVIVGAPNALRAFLLAYALVSRPMRPSPPRFTEDDAKRIAAAEAKRERKRQARLQRTR